MTSSPLQTLSTLLQDIVTNTRGVDVSELRNCQQFVSTEQRVNILRTTIGGGSGTALHFAASADDTNTFKCLLDSIPVEQKMELFKLQDVVGNTPVHKAAAKGHTDIIKCIFNFLSLEQQAELLKIVTLKNETALEIAVKHKRIEVADYLKLQLMSFHSTLPPSAENHSSTADNFLLNVKASPKTNKRSADSTGASPSSQPNIKRQKHHSMTSSQQTLEKLLNDAIDYKQVDIAELKNYLLSVSGEQRFHSLKNVVCGVSKDTALHRAAEKGCTDTIKCLLDGLPEHRLFHLLKIQNEVGDTALHRASLHGHIDIIKHIMDLLKPEQKTKLLDICNNSNETALKIARRENKEEVAEFLKDCGKDAKKAVKNHFKEMEARMKIQELQLEEKEQKIQEKDRKIQELEQSQDSPSNKSSDAHVEVDESVNGKFLGEGAFGKVYRKFDTQTKTMVAIKMVTLGSSQSVEITKGVKALCSELSVMKEFDHNRIVQYIRGATESNMLCIYMEYMAGGSVKDQLDTHGPFEEFLTQTYTKQILEGLSYLHRKGIIHRDVKGQNILCDGKGNIKLADFGISRVLLSIQSLSNEITNDVGTVCFQAPEVINSTDYAEKADVWSSGATVIQMLTARPPWRNFPKFQVTFLCGKGDYPVYNLNPKTSRNAESFLQLTFKSKEVRPTADELLQNPWLVNLPAVNEVLGGGAYGRVYLQFDSETNRMLAVKKIDIGPASGYISKREMKDLNHERIVQHIRVVTESNKLCIYMEYMAGGSLKDHLKKHGPFSEIQTQKYTKQILEGLSYLHEENIMHRDVRGSNILCDGSGNIKLANFAVSKQMLTIQTLTEETNQNTSGIGTAHWMAPEVINGEVYGRKADIWSSGAATVEMLTTYPPWHQYTSLQAMFKIGNLHKAAYVLDPAISGVAENFLALTFKPEKERPTAEDLLQHSWLSNS